MKKLLFPISSLEWQRCINNCKAILREGMHFTAFFFFFFFKTQLLAFTEVAMALTEPVRNQKGGQEHQRQLINLG